MTIPTIIIDEYARACRKYWETQAYPERWESAEERAFDRAYWCGRANALGVVLEQVYGLREHDLHLIEDDAIAAGKRIRQLNTRSQYLKLVEEVVE